MFLKHWKNIEENNYITSVLRSVLYAYNQYKKSKLNIGETVRMAEE